MNQTAMITTHDGTFVIDFKRNSFANIYVLTYPTIVLCAFALHAVRHASENLVSYNHMGRSHLTLCISGRVSSIYINSYIS